MGRAAPSENQLAGQCRMLHAIITLRVSNQKTATGCMPPRSMPPCLTHPRKPGNDTSVLYFSSIKVISLPSRTLQNDKNDSPDLIWSSPVSSGSAWAYHSMFTQVEGGRFGCSSTGQRKVRKSAQTEYHAKCKDRLL